MPELPEVETVLKTLLPKVHNRKITVVKVFHSQVIGWPDSPYLFAASLCGRVIEGGRRRGKFLILDLSGEKKLIIHLRMTGRLMCNGEGGLTPHTHLLIKLQGQEYIHFVDTRRFGRVYFIGAGEEKKAGNLSSLGPEPLSKEFTLKYLQEGLRRRGARIKGMLLDQNFLAGLGNIYADEILYRSRVHPATPASSLSKEDMILLHKNIREVLKEAISRRGTTFRDYRDSFNRAGSFQNFLQVYGREGKECCRCGRMVMREKISGRSSHFCPGCQEMGKDVDSPGKCRKKNKR